MEKRISKKEGKKVKYFITFEGIDGSGKSTISKIVYKKLKSNGHNVILTYEPTDSAIGKIVQECISKKSDPFVTVFTFIADRIEHGKKIKKWLSEGNIVLCDRYCDSTYSYQGAQLEEIIDNPIKWLKDLSNDIIPIPERPFLFEIAPEIALKRIQNRNNLIPFEKLEFLKKVHNNYLKLADEKRFLKIDATKRKDELVEICINDILS